MDFVMFEGRSCAQVADDELKVTVTQECGQVARILHRQSGVSPLWTSPWPSVEPSRYSPETHPQYGTGAEARLLASMLGHSLCLDVFGHPDAAEAAAGIPVHGEASVAHYSLSGDERSIEMTAELPKAQMTFSRRVELAGRGVVAFKEVLESQTGFDRPIAWTQHVTLGASFLEAGRTRFALSADRSRTFENRFNDGLGMQVDGAEFDWPLCPMKDGTVENLSILTSRPVSGGFTAHRLEPAQEHAFFIAWSERSRLAFGYVWRRADFPWLSRWEENHLRPQPPWNSRGFALGLEFGVSPMVESRRAMVERNRMFDTPTFRWLPARSHAQVKYCAFLRHAVSMPQKVVWDGDARVELI